MFVYHNSSFDNLFFFFLSLGMTAGGETTKCNQITCITRNHFLFKDWSSS